jgi:cytochrome b561
MREKMASHSFQHTHTTFMPRNHVLNANPSESADAFVSQVDVQRHHPLTIFLHWATLLLILLSAAAIFGRELVDDKAIQGELMSLHRSFGLLVLVLVLLRIIVRTLPTTEPVDHGLPLFLRLVAVASHGVIYVMLAGLPLLGWALSNARGVEVMLFGLLPLPRLIATDPDWADTLADFHEWGAWVLYAVIAVHASAALWHHHVRKDQVLKTMLPGWKRS